MNKGTVFVTGGAGFIGSHVNEQLNNEGYQTIVFDNLSTGNKKAVLQGTFIEGDLKDSELLGKIFSQEKILCVMHFAASIDVGESAKNPSKYYLNNVYNTLNLLNAMRTHNINHLIFSSSAAVYGIPEEDRVCESDLCLPINPYGETKLICEKILRDYNKAYGLRSCSLRYFNAAGGDPHRKLKNYKKNETNLIPIVLNCLKTGSPLTINGTDYPTPDGTCIRDYIHVADLGTAHILAMEKLLKEDCAECYNLGNGQGYSIREVIHAAEKVAKESVSCINGPRRAGDPPILLANAERANKELGWIPRHPSLDTIIKDAWEARI